MPIKFVKRYSVYNPGDVVAFEKAQAETLIASGVAVAAYQDINDRKPAVRKTITK